MQKHFVYAVFNSHPYPNRLNFQAAHTSIHLDSLTPALRHLPHKDTQYYVANILLNLAIIIDAKSPFMWLR